MVEVKPLEVLVIGYGNSDITFIGQLIRGLTQKGINVTIASANKGPIDQVGPGKLNWLWAPSWNVHPIQRIAETARLALTLPQLRRPKWFSEQTSREKGLHAKFETYFRYSPFTKGKWDVVYFPWNSAAIDYIGLFDAETPVVVSCRGSQINIRPHLKGQENYILKLTETLRRADAVHCVSEDILEQAKNYGLNPDKTLVIHPAVNVDFFVPPANKNENHTLKLVTTGSLIWNKGYEYLLVTISRLRDLGIETDLHIIGEGYERSRILFTAQDLGIENSVTLHGKLKPEQVRNQLQIADIFVFASLSEGLPNGVLEAMSCGLPVVTSDCGGVREAVTDDVEGFVVPAREPGIMAESLLKLALDSELRSRMGVAGRERVIKDFRLEDQVEAFISMFDSVRSRGN